MYLEIALPRWLEEVLVTRVVHSTTATISAVHFLRVELPRLVLPGVKLASEAKLALEVRLAWEARLVLELQRQVQLLAE
jgi:hypothetical protein